MEKFKVGLFCINFEPTCLEHRVITKSVKKDLICGAIYVVRNAMENFGQQIAPHILD